MVQPRFLVLCGRTEGGRDERVAVSWRLLGANNRELGRSPGTFPDLDSCQAALRDLVEGIAAATPSITSVRDRTGTWNWRLDLGGRAVAVAGRPYLRHRECTYNLAHFLAAVPAALVAEKQR
jgi:hypothetical protein